jgi:hypothetical protein
MDHLASRIWGFCRGGNVNVLLAWFSFLESTIGIDNVHRRDGYTRVSSNVLICPGNMSGDLMNP